MDWIVVVLALAYLIVLLPLHVRRLHDIGLRGWWLFSMLVPLADLGLVVHLLIKRGDDGPNRYGTDPRWQSASR